MNKIIIMICSTIAFCLGNSSVVLAELADVDEQEISTYKGIFGELIEWTGSFGYIFSIGLFVYAIIELIKNKRKGEKVLKPFVKKVIPAAILFILSSFINILTNMA